MRTATAKQVLEAIVRLEGRDPETAGLSVTQRATRAELLNDRIKEGWEYALWPESLVVEQRYYRPTWNTLLNFAIDDECILNDTYYRSLQNSNVNHSPDEVDSTFWVRIDTFIRSISLSQPDETVIGGIDVENGVFGNDPRIYRDAQAVRPCRLMGDSIYVEVYDAPWRPFLRFRPAAPEISWTDWNEATQYAIGDLCYLVATGESYKALAPSTGISPYEHPVQWEAVGIPAFLKTFLKHAVASDLLQEDQGKYKELARATDELERLYDTLIEQQGEGRKARFR